MKNLFSKSNSISSTHIDNVEKISKKQKKTILKNARTTQAAIRYQNIFQNGLCEIEPGLYSIACTFDDINYQIAKKETQIDIFGKWCEFLNYFDNNFRIQINVRCFNTNVSELKQKILIPANNDTLIEYRQEMNSIILKAATQGDNSISKEKIITISFAAEDYENAVIVKNRLEVDISKNFKSLGCKCSFLPGEARIQMLHDYFNEDTIIKFDYKNKYGITSKDYISPHRFDFTENNYFTFTVDDKLKYGSTVYLKNLPNDLKDRLINNLSDLPINITMSLHIEPIDQEKALTIVEDKLGSLDMERNEREDRNLEKSRPVESLPRRLKKAIIETEEFYNSLSNDNQRMFKITILVYVTGNDPKEIDENIKQVLSTARKTNVHFSYPLEQQEQCLNSILPIGKNHINIQRTLNTASTAIFIPFTGQEILQPTGIYYGINALTKKLLMADRSLLSNPNGFFIGVPGSGKSFMAKQEIGQILLKYPDDEVMIIDPEREYSPLAKEFHGEIIYLSSSSKTHINPMDLNENYGGGDETPIKAKAEFIISICETLIGGINGLGIDKRSIIDRSIILTYHRFKKPTLTNFYNVLCEQPEQAARSIALSLEMFIKGTLDVFAHETNINTNNKLLVFDTKDLGGQLNTMGMLVAQDMIWNRISENRAKKKRTWIFIDEAHLMFENESSADYCDKLWKRARKWGAIPTGVTQNVSGLMQQPKTRQMLSNCEFLCVMNQGADDRLLLQDILQLSEAQLEYITNADPGCGVIRAGSGIIPFINNFPSDTKLYSAMTTKFSEQV